eukprot:TRINITY_DN1134_c0_g2_i1.p1 TRINITY_DN1134_c0_g2~~TRINITY_DN1134_c0_g2_i1.p1  ORF type:complete len:173 (+),score=9.89 TRINITY_DN1134_c0_g2_i1:243-761(+)
MSACNGLEVDSREQLCYVPCTHCSTVLAVSVPMKSLYKVVTIRCGHCNNLLSVDMRGLTVPQFSQCQPVPALSLGQASTSSNVPIKNVVQDCDATLYSTGRQPSMTDVQRAPEKKQRISSAYNRFIKEEIQRIKACNPNMSHREAFSTAAKNWALFPYMQLGLVFDEHKQRE